MLTCPPLKAYLLILVLICLAVSDMKMAELGSEADIFPVGPDSAARNLE